MNFTVKKRILIVIGIVFALALMIFYRFFTQTTIGLTISFFSLIAYFILTLILRRCPHCNSYLWKLVPFATHCPYCGEELK